MLPGASLVFLRAEGRGAPAATCAPLPTVSRDPLLAEGRGAPKSPCVEPRAEGRAALLLDTVEAFLAEAMGPPLSGLLPSAPAAACADALLPSAKLGTLFLPSGRCLADAIGAAAAVSDSSP